MDIRTIICDACGTELEITDPHIFHKHVDFCDADCLAVFHISKEQYVEFKDIDEFMSIVNFRLVRVERPASIVKSYGVEPVYYKLNRECLIGEKAGQGIVNWYTNANDLPAAKQKLAKSVKNSVITFQYMTPNEKIIKVIKKNEQ